MYSRLRSRVPSHTTVVAYLALFLAVGGGTTAVALQGRNTVNSADIINQEVKSNDIQENGIRPSRTCVTTACRTVASPAQT